MRNFLSSITSQFINLTWHRTALGSC
jgi:hypothetical protein